MPGGHPAHYVVRQAQGGTRLAEVIEGASLVREFQGAYANVLTYKEWCNACGYLAPKTSFAFSMLPYEGSSYDTEGFLCPGCAKYQAVRIRLDLGGWATGLR